jgi:uncharacterized RDD family membrane protein YckC
MPAPPAGGPGRGHAGAGPIVTPDVVPLELEVATLGSRGIAYVLDLLIWGSALLMVAVAQALLGGAGFVPGSAGIALLLLAAFALQFGYPIGFETLWRGRTPGKATLGLRVVTVEGAPVGVRHATIRATVGLLELLATVGVIAVVSSFASRRGQRLGDLAAGTIVVREPRGGRAVAAERFEAPAGLEGYVARLDVSGLGARDYATLRDTLRRLPTLGAGTRERIASELATSLVARVTPPPPTGIAPEPWLRCVAAAVQRRGRSGPAAVPPAPPAPPPAATTGPDGAGDPTGPTGTSVGEGQATGEGQAARATPPREPPGETRPPTGFAPPG